MYESYYLWTLFFIQICFISASSNSNETNKLTLKKYGDVCDRVLTSFAKASGNYTACVIQFARPIKLCQSCVVKYQTVVSIHNDILTFEDPDNNNTCKDQLTNLDKLQVVNSGFDYVYNLWQRASCNKCFELDSGGIPKEELNQHTKEILKLSNLTHTCINEHRHDNGSHMGDPPVCSICKDKYLELNSHYDSLKSDGFCMDIVDMMNHTRALWSTDLKCCMDRKQPEWLFLVSSIVFSCLPFVFYLSAFMFVTRKEQTVHKQRRLQERHSTTASTSSIICD